MAAPGGALFAQPSPTRHAGEEGPRIDYTPSRSPGQETHTYGPPRARVPPRRSDLPLTRAEAHRMVAAVYAAIGDAIAKNESVSIAGFDTFNNRYRPARQGRNPRTGETIAIPASRVPAFRAGTALPDAVNKPRE